jgi:hypothetical protein
LAAIVAEFYLLLTLMACVVAARRLAVSTDMPGLAAIELVLLALPWSLLLEAPGLRQAGWFFMALIVFSGVLINALLVYAVGRAFQRWWRSL